MQKGPRDEPIWRNYKQMGKKQKWVIHWNIMYVLNAESEIHAGHSELGGNIRTTETYNEYPT